MDTGGLMAENEIDIAVPRGRVFEILADPDRYAEWVVGASRVRDADSTWPAPGARLHHSVGADPLTVDDSTEVLECEEPDRLVLLAHIGPLGSFRVELLLRDDGEATHVTMLEHPVEGISKLGGPATSAVIKLRNALSLDRLKELAES
jgi:uncharacterized protein YndB with AHSA1/START domain